MPMSRHGHRTPSPMVYQPARSSPPGAARQIFPRHLHLSYDFTSPSPSHHLHLPPADIIDTSLLNGNPRSGNPLGHAISAEPMCNVNISSRELEMAFLESVEAFNLSADLNSSSVSRDSEPQSLTNIVNDAYNQFTKEQLNKHPKSS